jgi:hypothetical protein
MLLNYVLLGIPGDDSDRENAKTPVPKTHGAGRQNVYPNCLSVYIILKIMAIVQHSMKRKSSGCDFITRINLKQYHYI